jgi:hypothetical protein
VALSRQPQRGRYPSDCCKAGDNNLVCVPRKTIKSQLTKVQPNHLLVLLCVLQLKDMQKEVLRYKRSDGVDLTGVLLALR